MIVPVLFGLAAVVLLLGVPILSARRARRRMLSRIRGEWGSPRRVPRDMEAAADFFRLHDGPESIDDRTWNDLLMDDVFAHLDRTESSAGQQVLYRRLRRASAP